MSTALADSVWEQGTRMAATSFARPALLARLDAQTRLELDALPFGAVRTDAAGVVTEYNRYESQLAGVAPSEAIGRNFYTEVAPCTNNAVFYGSFKRGVAAGAYSLAFVYTFSYRMTPTPVRIHLHHAAGGGHWILVEKK